MLNTVNEPFMHVYARFSKLQLRNLCMFVIVALASRIRTLYFFYFFIFFFFLGGGGGRVVYDGSVKYKCFSEKHCRFHIKVSKY